MSITWLDILLVVIMLVSGVLAMIRGFLRETLSLASWAAAAIATVMLYDKLLPIAETNIGAGTIAKAVVIAGVFFITLLLATLLTARISNLVLDSRIGALDRTLGFIFGLARGLVIVVVAFYLFTWFVPDRNLPQGVRDAKSRQTLQTTGKWLQSLLPSDVDNYISSMITKMFPRKPDSPDGPPGKRSERNSLSGTQNTVEQQGYERSERAGMQQLIQDARR